MKQGKILISDLKQNTEKIHSILNSQRMFKNFLEFNDNFINKIVSKVSAIILGERKINDANLDYDTLYQVGRLALFNAMKDFNEEKNATLSTFAYTVVKNDVTRHVNKQLKIKQHEESIESFCGRNNSSVINYDESHFVPTYGKHGEFVDDVLNKIIFEQHFYQMDKEQQRIYKMLTQGLTFKEIRSRMGIKRRKMRKICERELPQKMLKMRKALEL